MGALPPEYGVDLQPIDFVKAAEACGAHGVRIDDPEQCGDAIEAALAMPGPVVVEAVVDPLDRLGRREQPATRLRSSPRR